MGWSIYMVVDGLNSARYLQRQLTNLISTICNIKAMVQSLLISVFEICHYQGSTSEGY